MQCSTHERSDLSLRRLNPLRELLSRSSCFVRLRAERSLGPACFDAVKSAYADVGAITQITYEGDECVLSVEVTHDRIDAYGLMVLAAEHGPRSALAVSPSVVREGRVGSCLFVHHARTAVAGPSFTRRLASSIAARLGLSGTTRIGFAVALADPWPLTAESAGGNGFLIVELEAERIARLGNAGQEVWREELRKNAKRLHAVAEKRPDLLRANAAINISSLGDVRRLPWGNSPSLHPAQYEQVSTPDPRAINVVVWAHGETQAIGICGASDHPLFHRRAEIVSGWLETLA